MPDTPETSPAPETVAEPTLMSREAGAIAILEKASVERARAEVATEQGFRARRETEEKGFQEALQKLTTTGKAEIASTEARYKSLQVELRTKFDAERQKVEQEYAEVRKRAAQKANSAKKVAKKEHEETRWQILAVFESGKDSSVKQNKQAEAELAGALEQLQNLRDEAEYTLVRTRKFAGAAAEAPAVTLEPVEDPLPALQERLTLADERLTPLANLKLPKFLAPQQFIWPFVFLAAALVVPLGLFVNWIVGGVVGVVVAIAAGVGIWFWLAGKARRGVGALYPPFLQALSEADALAVQYKDFVKANFERRKAQVEQKRQDDTQQSDDKLARLSAEADQRAAQELKQAEEKYPPLIAEIEKRRAEATAQVEERYPKKIAELKATLESNLKQLHENYRQQKEATQKAYTETWDLLISRWRKAVEEATATIDDVNAICSRLFMDWHTIAPDDWSLPTAVPPALRFGELEVAMNQIPHGVPADPRLKGFGPDRYAIPALLPFPVQGSMLLKAFDAGKAVAAQLLQSMMLRYVTSIPAGKVRFTIVDPVGLGENFAAFMHLADYSELLITSRIWTETSHIEQKLTDLQEHMENVIQKYLRNEFNTIEEYNVHAGEVAEPFRVLVVANFPVNFSETAARRLVSIASSGARCGVYTLISVDTKQPLPSGVQLKDLEPYCLNLTWKDGKYHWRDQDFNKWPLKLDTPPGNEAFSRLVHIAGEAAKNANRVEVPFDYIAPKPEDYWTESTARGIDVPLGRAGATKLQHLKLGKGTSQHVLIAGKTGSGKSTLLHALIMNAALRYSPDELQLYLIDFKKGVEFKVYAALELPHAKVIAVESEREFGLSVLQRLDAELKMRGELFRDLGVQDLGAYRKLENQPPLPRILFIVDEFQEFFVEDDKIAQDVSLLLDRMVRQGRAFGVHVHLGSQSLGGAYSLPRTTLGQMAVRIALQCSESDANLILSEDNSAARLLTRPGEAIYNDQNGMVEGNNFFQVVWLTDERREQYLEDLQELRKKQNRPRPDQIVFEGNLPAVQEKNPLLTALLEAPDWPVAPKADYAWLGEAIAIKDPTAAIFRPQSGSNLLMVGQNDEGALGMLSTAIVGLAAQHVPAVGERPSAGVRFFILDGSPVDSLLNGKLGKLGEVLPHPIKDVTWREIKETLASIAAEVDHRQKEPGDTPPIYLIVYDLQRFRDLRKGDDDFGFSRYGEEKEAPPSKLFTNILRDGPPVGVHTIVWCDSLNNLNRTFDRQGLKEFEIRVLFQMSANDSSTLIDSPAASKLGENRALFFSEEEGRIEKFRPYGLPTDEWLASVRDRLKSRKLPELPAAQVGHGDNVAAAEAPVAAEPVAAEHHESSGNGDNGHSPDRVEVGESQSSGNGDSDVFLDTAGTTDA